MKYPGGAKILWIMQFLKLPNGMDQKLAHNGISSNTSVLKINYMRNANLSAKSVEKVLFL